MRGPLQRRGPVLEKIYEVHRLKKHAPRRRYARRDPQNREVRADDTKNTLHVDEHLSADTRCRASHRVSMSWVGTAFVRVA